MPTTVTISRRRLLGGAAAVALLPLPAVASPVSAPPAAAAKAFHIVNGWILTSDDMVVLGLHDR